MCSHRLLFLAAGAAIGSPVAAQQAATSAAPPATAPTGPAAPAPVTLSTPSMTGPLALDAKPLSGDGGPLGRVYVSGVISGLGLVQDHPFPGDRRSRLDLSNAIAIVQTTSGLVQFYTQVGGYSLASLGTPYIKAGTQTRQSFGLLPVAYLKIVPSSEFSIEAGKLYTLQGAENLFTFQNFNIERGLLWNQTASVNRGVQANYSHGPLSVSVSLNDGFFSAKYNWLSGTVGYTLSPKDSLTLGVAANLSRTNKSNFTTPIALNNGQLYFLSWTHGSGPWTIQPYVQWQHTPRYSALGIVHSASTYGGAVLGKYSFNDHWALASRAEIIKSTGSVANGAPNLLYGPGSGAWSLTLTPTWQNGILFARAEGSYIHAFKPVPGSGLGPDFNNRSQVRGLVEAGVIF